MVKPKTKKEGDGKKQSKAKKAAVAKYLDPKKSQVKSLLDMLR